MQQPINHGAPLLQAHAMAKGPSLRGVRSLHDVLSNTSLRGVRSLHDVLSNTSLRGVRSLHDVAIQPPTWINYVVTLDCFATQSVARNDGVFRHRERVRSLHDVLSNTSLRGVRSLHDVLSNTSLRGVRSLHDVAIQPPTWINYVVTLDCFATQSVARNDGVFRHCEECALCTMC